MPLTSKCPYKFGPSRWAARPGWCAVRPSTRGDRLRREPHGQAAAGAQASIVLGPVGHPVPLLGDQTAVEIEPQSTLIRFTRQVRHQYPGWHEIRC